MMDIARKIINIIRQQPNISKMKKMGFKVGENLCMQGGCIIDYSHCWLIEIGNNVTLAPRVYILAHDASTKLHLGYTKIGRVTIGNKVFIGANTTILPNVSIGDNCIIGANSIVTKNIPPNSVAVGNPARVVELTSEYLEKCKQLMKIRPSWSKEYTLKNKKMTNEMRQIMKDKLNDGIGFVE